VEMWKLKGHWSWATEHREASLAFGLYQLLRSLTKLKIRMGNYGGANGNNSTIENSDGN